MARGAITGHGGTCIVCAKNIRLRKDGRIRTHGAGDDRLMNCSGSSHWPVEHLLAGAMMATANTPDSDPLAVFEDVKGPHPRLWLALRIAHRKAIKNKVPRNDGSNLERERCAYTEGYLAGMVHACAEATGTDPRRFYELLENQ